MEAWMTPDGELIEVRMGGHNDYAYSYLEKELADDRDKFLELVCDESPNSILHQRGWIRIRKANSGRIEIVGDCMSLVALQRNTIDPAMNSKQMRVAKALCKEYNTPFHEAINDKRFW